MNNLDIRQACSQDDFTGPDDVQMYGLGLKLAVDTIDNEYTTVYYYFKAAVDLDAYHPVEIGRLIEGVPPVNPDFNMEVVFPQFDVLAGQYAFGVYQGKCKATCKTDTVAQGIHSYFRASASNIELVTQLGPTTLNVASVGVILEEIPANTTKTVDFIALGRGVKIYL